MTETVSIINLDTFSKAQCPKIGWMFPCSVCDSITSKQVVVKEKYKLYVCKDCNCQENTVILEKEILKYQKKNKRKIRLTARNKLVLSQGISYIEPLTPN